MDYHGLPVRMTLTEGTTAEDTEAPDLIAGEVAHYMSADRGCDRDAVIAQAEQQEWKQTYRPGETARNPGTTTGHCTIYVTC